MMTLSAGDAFEAYEAVRHRLPLAQPEKSRPRLIENLADIADQFDVFLLDAFGVLNIGEDPIPDVPERVRDLQSSGKRVLVVSNAASVSVDALAQKYDRLGYSFTIENIITSRKATIAGMSDAPDLRWGVMGLETETMDDFEQLNWHALRDDPRDYDIADGFLLVSTGDWTAKRQTLLLNAQTHRPRPMRVANPDIVAPRGHVFSTEPGRFAHTIADATGVTPEFFGKPFKNIYDLVFEQLGTVDTSRIVMVGDSLHTDVLGAHAAGIASVLISDYGFFADENVEAAIHASGITPDFIAGRP